MCSPTRNASSNRKNTPLHGPFMVSMPQHRRHRADPVLPAPCTHPRWQPWPEMVFRVSGCQGMGAEPLHQFVHACAPRANASPIKWLSPPSGKLGRQPQYTVTQRPCRASAAYTSRRSCAVVASLQHWAAQQILVLHPRRIMLPPRR